jgi:hypothetical protein
MEMSSYYGVIGTLVCVAAILAVLVAAAPGALWKY